MTTADPAARLITATDLLQMPDDGTKCELVAGHLVRDQLPGQNHGTILATIAYLLSAWARETKAGTVSAGDPGFQLRRDPDTVRGPDVAFLAGTRYADAGRPPGYWQGAPDLAVEVVSPTDRMVEVLAKVRDYLDTGAQQVWVVEPQGRTVTVHRSLQDVRILTEDDTFVGDGPVEGFRVGVGDLFD